MEHAHSPRGALSFELLAEIAVGQTARVELCRLVQGPHDGELISVKRLHPHIAEDPSFVDMFRDEVWMTSALKHPNVVEVVGWGTDSEGLYFAVELVRGVSLMRLMKTVFETGEMFSERMVVFLASCICSGLAAAHGLRATSGEHLNLVHRDLTPGNVLVGFDGEVKITDFGLAKAKQRLTRTLTGLLKGQPQYMSPEQIRAEPLDGRADIFAMGVLLFELFGGRRPWNAGNDLEAMRAITEQTPQSLADVRPKMDKALVDVVHRCLEKDPARRFQSAHELRERFDQWLLVHGYREGNPQALARFVRRNAMRQMRWFERAVAGEFAQAARDGRPAIGGDAALFNDDPTSPDRPVESHAADTARGSGPGHAGPPDDVDWGDEGPTLIQRSERARELIASMRKGGRGSHTRAAEPTHGQPETRGRPETARLPVSEPTTRRRSEEITRAAARDPLDIDEPSPPVLLRPGRPASDAPPSRPPRDRTSTQATRVRTDAPRAPDSGDADSTRQMNEAQRVHTLVAAGVAPEQLLGGRPGVVVPHEPDIPPPPRAAPVTMPMGELPLHDPPTPQLLGAVPIPLMPDSVRGSSPHGSSEMRRMLAPPDFNAEAARLAEDARRAGEEARRAAEDARRTADLADAAARAATLSAEAALLASAGDPHQAIARLLEAQRLDEMLRMGQVPVREPYRIDGDVHRLMPPHRRLLLAYQGLQQRDVVMLAVFGTAALLLVALLFALVF